VLSGATSGAGLEGGIGTRIPRGSRGQIFGGSGSARRIDFGDYFFGLRLDATPLGRIAFRLYPRGCECR
jgi:hypothetical protein